MQKKKRIKLIIIIFVILIVFLCISFLKSNKEITRIIAKNNIKISESEYVGTKKYINNNIYGITLHILNIKDNDLDKSISEIKNAGFNSVRIEIKLKYATNSDKKLNLDKKNYIEKIEKIKNSGLNVCLIIGTDFANDDKISSEEDLKLFEKYLSEIKEKLDSYVDYYEIINEPNVDYKSDQDFRWYVKAIEVAYKILDKNKVVVGASMQDDNKFNKKLLEAKLNNFIYNISFHCYNLIPKYDDYEVYISDFNNLVNKNGGFQRKMLSETGIPSVERIGSERGQAIDIIKFMCIYRNLGIEDSYLYNFRNTGVQNDVYAKDYYEKNYGLVNSDFTQKMSFSAIQTYYNKVGNSKLVGNYNKVEKFKNLDGIILLSENKKIQAILWNNDEKNPTTIDYNNFDATDLYGNAIENTNGKLEITSSPVYLDNISANYFYQAISNSIIDGYSKFKNKFKDEISKVNGLNEKIDNLSNEAKNIYSLSEMDENTAKNLMKEHFDLGNDLINAYNNGSLKVEYVKLSSMLDSLNTIGNSYEDLVTISAKTRMTDLSEITDKVNKAKSLAEDNEQFDIVYPNKIYKFAQDLLDTSTYVLGLDEENDIKTGLINSKALHAKYLAEWSQEFSKIYIKDALKTSTNSIVEKNETIKNNNKVVYENPNVKNSYDKLQNSINTLIENPETNNVDEIYSNQINIAQTIVNEVNNKQINLEKETYKNIISDLFNITDNYKDLCKYYVTTDNTDKTEIENKLNGVINRYNENLDIEELSKEAELVNKLSDIFNNNINTDSVSDNYINEQRILKSCDVISSMLENDIKQQADTEFEKISYTTEQGNNSQERIVTIKLPNEKCKIVDNDGSNQLTFTQNDTKIVKVNIRGYEYNYQVMVNSIRKETNIPQHEEKTQPTLDVPESGTSFAINTANSGFDKITITKDGKDVNYNSGDIISNPGIYEINAVDKNGKQVNAKSIVYSTFTNEQNTEEKYVPIASGTKAKNIIENSEYSIIKDNRIKSDDDNIATGDKLKSQNDTYTVIVKGDITGSGKADIMSLVQLRKNLVGLKDFTKIQQLASDVNSDGKTNIVDLVRERKLIVGVE